MQFFSPYEVGLSWERVLGTPRYSPAENNSVNQYSSDQEQILHLV